MYHFAVFQFQGRVFCAGTFPDHSQNAGHGCAAKVILPVQFDQSRQNDGHFQFNGIQCADFCFQIHITDGRFVRICFSAHGTKYTAVDIKMRIIDGIYLFGCHLIIACGCRINSISTAHCGDTDFTGTYAIRRTHGTHTGEWADMLRVTQFCSIERRT